MPAVSAEHAAYTVLSRIRQRPVGDVLSRLDAAGRRASTPDNVLLLQLDTSLARTVNVPSAGFSRTPYSLEIRDIPLFFNILPSYQTIPYTLYFCDEHVKQ